MGDVSDLYRRALKTLHRDVGTTMGQNAQDRKEMHNNARKNRRETEAFFRRNIDENMSPLVTPVATPVVEKTMPKKETRVCVNDIANLPKEKPEAVSTSNIISASDRRLAMLNKWKAEKDKQKAVDKAKAKPLFKVCHVYNSVIPDLENINKTIKGKPFSRVTPKPSKFAPVNHNFKPPGNLRPVSLTRGPKLDVLAYVKTLEFEAPQKIKKSPPKKAKIESGKCKPNLKRVGISAITKAASQNNLEAKPAVAGSSRTTRSATVKATNSAKSCATSKTNKKSPTKLAEQLTKLKITSPKRNIRTKKAPASSSEKQIVDSSSHGDAVIVIDDSPIRKFKVRGAVSQDNTISTTVKDRSAKSVSKENKVVGDDSAKSDSKGRKVVGDDSAKSVSKGRKVVDGDDSPTSNSTTAAKSPKKNVDFNVRGVETKEKISKTPKKSVGFNVGSSTSITTTPKQGGTPGNKHRFRKTPLRNNKDLESSSSLDSQSFRSASDDYPIEYSESDRSVGSDNVFTMPIQNVENEPAVYISPFVTISRGKLSAKKEYAVRKSLGKHDISLEDSQFVNLLNKTTSPQAGAAYFTRKLNSEINKIELMCAEWQKYLDGSEVPDEAKDSIHVTIGQSRLLIAKKFQQFRGLIEECQTQTYSEKPVTCEDLHGFWDMIYMQVENLDKRFNELQTRRQNGWEEVILEKSKPTATKKGRGRPKKTQTSSKLKNLIAAARQKKAAIQTTAVDEDKLFVGGYFEIRSPLVKSYTPSQRKSINRLSVLTAENNSKRCSSSPGLLMMKVSQAIKQGGGLTPARSILKTDNSKSTGKKSVLFKQELVTTKECKVVLFSNSEDEEEVPLEGKFGVKMQTPENKENMPTNLISLSPATPLRRSTRSKK